VGSELGEELFLPGLVVFCHHFFQFFVCSTQNSLRFEPHLALVTTVGDYVGSELGEELFLPGLVVFVTIFFNFLFCSNFCILKF
jgi:energy-converting hydrogenase Eha subunit G